MSKNTINKPSNPATSADKERIIKETPQQMPLVRNNFILMVIAAIMIIGGFLLMCGAGSTDTEFNPDIFSTRRIVVGPAIAFLGYIFMGVAIMWQRKSKSANTEE